MFKQGHLYIPEIGIPFHFFSHYALNSSNVNYFFHSFPCNVSPSLILIAPNNLQGNEMELVQQTRVEMNINTKIK